MPRQQQALYAVHPSVAYAQSILRKLPENTGKSIAEWIRVLERSGPADEKQRRDWLKKQHKLGGTTAGMIAERASGKGAEDTDERAYLQAAAGYVDAMYSGAKAALRPIHDGLIELGRSLGRDVKIGPCKTIVPLYRNHVFAEIKPSTRTRIDLGLALKGSKAQPGQRLLGTGGAAKGDRITHRIPITDVAQIDAEVRRWLQIAYDLDA